MKDLAHILDKAKILTGEVSKFIGKESQTFDKADIEHKGFNDLVSYVDKEAELLLVAGCKEILPEAGFITEEGTETTRAEEYNWIIDPLDGTTNFTHGLPVFAISLALLHHDEIVMGIVHEVNRDECFSAYKGGGAFCNGARMHVSAVSSLNQGLIATGFPYYDFDQMPQYLQILNSFMRSSHGLRRMGSAAVDLAYTACGRFEGFFEYNLNAWDVAAGIILVKEAGGEVTDFKGGNNCLFGREIVASGNIHKEMTDIIQQHWKI